MTTGGQGWHLPLKDQFTLRGSPYEPTGVPKSPQDGSFCLSLLN
jgi:hypothetical protein